MQPATEPEPATVDTPATQGLFTPTMLANVLGVSAAAVRSWQRRGLIRPVRTLNRVTYFDFRQLVTARQLAELPAQGISPAALQRKLASLARWLPNPSLDDLTWHVEGNQLVVRRNGMLVEADGQYRLDFEEDFAGDADEVHEDVVPFQPLATGLADTRASGVPSREAPRLRRMAEQLEDEGRLDEAIEVWRTWHLVAGPHPDTCFRLGELLYLRGDLAAARERYYVALEIDPTLVEVRASLGCVLLELGEHELAVAALRGALDYDATYPDVHYHLASALEAVGEIDAARDHWNTFLRLTPPGPWTEHARARLAETESV